MIVDKNKTMICPICHSVAKIIFKKKEYDYFECCDCKSLFVPGGINQAEMVGGGFEVERNTTQNEERINRFKQLVGMYGSVLDFGCGHGMLVNDCRAADLACDGYDKFNDKFDSPISKKYNLISIVEVIEHLFSPYSELNEIFDSLSDNGIVYIETSFVDVAIEENIKLEDFFYINPDVGHCTIFSHKGLDLLMQARGFTPVKHINRNTRVYQKKKRMMTLITPTQGNPVALKRTIDSLKGVVNEVIVGSVCVFKEDEEIIESYNGEINLKLIKFPFNYIFCNGFSNMLNTLAEYASNDFVLYLNVGEVVEEGKDEILSKLSNDFNCYYIDHATETHHWYRVYNKKEIQWGGMIHEELAGATPKPCTTIPLFRFADTDKDEKGSFYEHIMLESKEAVYFNLYLKLAEQSHLVDNTNVGWVNFAKEGYHSFIDRLHQKGDLYEAFLTGNRGLLMKYIDEQKTIFNPIAQ